MGNPRVSDRGKFVRLQSVVPWIGDPTVSFAHERAHGFAAEEGRRARGVDLTFGGKLDQLGDIDEAEPLLERPLTGCRSLPHRRRTKLSTTAAVMLNGRMGHSARWLHYTSQRPAR